MNKRQVIILWIIALVLAGAVTVVKLTQKDTRQSATQRAPGEMLFESFPGADVANLEIQGAAGSVNLLKKDGKWTVTQRDGYPANPSFVNDFLRGIGELKITRSMEAGPSFAPRFGMDETSSKAEDRGITASFKDASGKELAKVSLGKNIETGALASPMGGANAVGRYVRNHADESGFYASSQMFPSVSIEAARWLADGFFSPEKIKTIALSQSDKNDPAWKLTRESEEAEFKLENAASNEVLDTAVSAPLKSLFSYARFDDVVPADKVAERSEATGKRTAIIETFEGFTYTIAVIPAKASATPPPPADPSNPTPPSTDKMLLTVNVTAELPKERKKEENEKPEDAKTKDAAFTERLKTLSEKLEKEKALAGRTFEVGKTTVDALLKERQALITKATPPPVSKTPAAGAVQQMPGGFIAPPPGTGISAATPPIEAVTPPVQAATPPIEAVSPPIQAVTPPVEKPAPPVEKPAPPVEKPAPPVEKPAPPVEKPAPPVETSAPPVEKPAPPVEKPAPPVETSAPPVETSAPPVETSAPPVEKPAPPVEKPAPPVEKPAPPVETSAPPVEKPAPPVETSAPPVETSAPPVETSAPPVEKPALPV